MLSNLGMLTCSDKETTERLLFAFKTERMRTPRLWLPVQDFAVHPFSVDAPMDAMFEVTPGLAVLSLCCYCSALCKPAPRILANVIIFICGNLAGAYHKHLMELALQQTYQDTCNCIKSRIKLEFEKRQQNCLQNSTKVRETWNSKRTDYVT
ncbi:hypothetical protein CB1_064113020 [Camelus ferus]|nr:hypothetical protein CB1_064113020 [Camelus ferus]